MPAKQNTKQTHNPKRKKQTTTDLENVHALQQQRLLVVLERCDEFEHLAAVRELSERGHLFVQGCVDWWGHGQEKEERASLAIEQAARTRAQRELTTEEAVPCPILLMALVTSTSGFNLPSLSNAYSSKKQPDGSNGSIRHVNHARSNRGARSSHVNLRILSPLRAHRKKLNHRTGGENEN